jgi:hypothetical protein
MKEEKILMIMFIVMIVLGLLSTASAYVIVYGLLSISTIQNDTGINESLYGYNSSSIPMPCEFEYNPENKDWVSVDCREECGCEVLAEYTFEVDVKDMGSAISDIINNRSNRTWS